ncbi:MAG: hypothetical protein HQM16_16525 [Deltaproteobacteria bacterium]|nr:hypothetical protein [Deltaproteobacteria bacterium]
MGLPLLLGGLAAAATLLPDCKLFGGGDDDDDNTTPPSADPKDTDSDGAFSCDSYSDDPSLSAQCQDMLNGRPQDCNDDDASVNPNASETCDNKDNNCNGETDEGVKQMFFADADGDGFGNPLDFVEACACPDGYVENDLDEHDDDATIYPEAPELCDGKDNNMDGTIDEGVANVYYADADGDNYGDPASSTTTCASTPPASFVPNDNDCDDTNSSINPEATETCDNIDNNCNDEIDEGATQTFYADVDNDGFGNPLTAVADCSQPDGYVANNLDETNEDPTVYPDAPELCDGKDNNMDGMVDEGVKTTAYVDADNDGYGSAALPSEAVCNLGGYALNNNDCDDANLLISPSAREGCDGVDNNCNDLIDEAIADRPSINTEGLCENNVRICSDGRFVESAENYVPQPETCDGLDNDCANGADDGLTDRPASNTQGLCAGNTEFCNGTNGWQTSATNYTPATEQCDGLDNDCAGGIDNGLPLHTWYADTDSDNYGDPATSTTNCHASYPAHVSNFTDCNDADRNINPTAAEVPYDGIDNDCTNGDLTDADGDGLDAQIVGGTDCNDNDPLISGPALWFSDADQDGFGNPTDSILSCDQPLGYITDSSDEPNEDPTIYPNAPELCDGKDNNMNGTTDEGVTNACGQCGPTPTEVCDGQDNDCDGSTDEDLPQYTWYADADNDTYGDPNASTSNCNETYPSYVSNTIDCNDSNRDINPAATEVPYDGIDNDCANGDLTDTDGDGLDAQIVGGTDCNDNAPLILGPTLWYRDADQDTFGDPLDFVEACVQPAGYVANNLDILDDDSTIYPNAPELCDGKDNNMNGNTDEGVTQTFYADVDSDGYGNPLSTVTACSQPDGYVADNSDDTNEDPTIYPNAPEVCDNKDNNMNGLNDDGIANILATNTQGLCVNNEMVCVEGEYVEAETNYTPSAETCDGLDNDCENGIDDDLADRPASNTQGECASNLESCEGTAGYQPKATNHTPTDEICDGYDNNCNNETDEGVQTTYYIDNDGDLHGDAQDTTGAPYCADPGVGYSLVNDDCNDANASISPSASEDRANLGDEDCDGQSVGSVENNEFSWYSTVAQSWQGYSMSAAGDMDKDGFDDYLSCKPDGTLTTQGACYLLFGGQHTLIGSEYVDGYSNRNFKLTGETNGDFFGYAVAGNGDLDGDGNNDVVVTSRYNNSSRGAAYIFYGPITGNMSASAASAKISGISTTDQIGHSVVVGDINCDYIDDIVIGAHFYGATGAAFVFFGQTTRYSGMLTVANSNTTIIGNTENDLTGYALATGGDVNNDNCEDLMVSAVNNQDNGAAPDPTTGVPTGSGKAGLFFGSPATFTNGATLNLDDNANMIFKGSAGLDLLSADMTLSGDVEGDGYSDIALSALYQSTSISLAGAVYVIAGSTVMDNFVHDNRVIDFAQTAPTTKISGTHTGQLTGSAIVLTDLNSDGLAELIVGANSSSNNFLLGAVNIFKNPFSRSAWLLTDADIIIEDIAYGYHAGNAVCNIGDADNDGLVDLLIGADLSDRPNNESGNVYLFTGASLQSSF